MPTLIVRALATAACHAALGGGLAFCGPLPTSPSLLIGACGHEDGVTNSGLRGGRRRRDGVEGEGRWAGGGGQEGKEAVGMSRMIDFAFG